MAYKIREQHSCLLRLAFIICLGNLAGYMVWTLQQEFRGTPDDVANLHLASRIRVTVWDLPHVQRLLESAFPSPNYCLKPNLADLLTDGPRLGLYMNFDDMLGTMMFQAASLVAIARCSSRRPYAKVHRENSELFPQLRVKYLKEPPPGDLPRVWEVAPRIFSPSLLEQLPPGDLQVCCFLQSYKYFAGMEGDIRMMFSIEHQIKERVSDHLRAVAKNALLSYAMTSAQNVQENTTLTFIGMHVQHKAGNHGYRLPTYSYYAKAMAYFRERSEFPVFLICDSDNAFAKRIFRHDNPDLLVEDSNGTSEESVQYPETPYVMNLDDSVDESQDSEFLELVNQDFLPNSTVDDSNYVDDVDQNDDVWLERMFDEESSEFWQFHEHDSVSEYVCMGEDFLDLALLSQCNHTITGSGSLGWWASFLADGETIFYKDFLDPNSDHSLFQHADDLYPSHWLPMSD